METAAVVHQVLLDGLIACTCINLCSFIFKLLFPIKIHFQIRYIDFITVYRLIYVAQAVRHELSADSENWVSGIKRCDYARLMSAH